MTKKLYQQLLNSALRRRLKEMTNWIFLNLFFSILRFCFLLHLFACALASSILLFFFFFGLELSGLYLCSSLPTSSFFYRLFATTASAGFSSWVANENDLPRIPSSLV